MMWMLFSQTKIYINVKSVFRPIHNLTKCYNLITGMSKIAHGCCVNFSEISTTTVKNIKVFEVN